MCDAKKELDNRKKVGYKLTIIGGAGNLASMQFLVWVNNYRG